MIGIYAIVNTTTNKCYVGKSTKIENRFKQHIKELEKGTHHSKKLQKAYDDLGAETFEFKVLELCSEDQLDAKEKEWIKKLDSLENGYNVQNPGIYSTAIIRNDEEDNSEKISMKLIMKSIYLYTQQKLVKSRTELLDIINELIDKWESVNEDAKMRMFLEVRKLFRIYIVVGWIIPFIVVLILKLFF